MNREVLDTFDVDMRLIGAKNRDAVHKDGDWHQTFHCWILLEDNLNKYLLFQIRGENKDTFPKCFDVSSAGHLLSGEKIKDGVREVKEELGIDINIEDMSFIGVVKEIRRGDTFTDREFNHIYLHKTKLKITDFIFQIEEIKGLSKISIKNIKELLQDKIDSILVETIEIDGRGEIVHLTKKVTKDNFVPHSEEYYNLLFNKLLKF